MLITQEHARKQRRRRQVRSPNSTPDCTLYLHNLELLPHNSHHHHHHGHVSTLTSSLYYRSLPKRRAAASSPCLHDTLLMPFATFLGRWSLQGRAGPDAVRLTNSDISEEEEKPCAPNCSASDAAAQCWIRLPDSPFSPSQGQMKGETTNKLCLKKAGLGQVVSRSFPNYAVLFVL